MIKWTLIPHQDIEIEDFKERVSSINACLGSVLSTVVLDLIQYTILDAKPESVSNPSMHHQVCFLIKIDSRGQ